MFFKYEPLFVSKNPLIIKKKWIESKEILKFQLYEILHFLPNPLLSISYSRILIDKVVYSISAIFINSW